MPAKNKELSDTIGRNNKKKEPTHHCGSSSLYLSCNQGILNNT